MKFEALLHLAPERGLVELTTTIVSVSEVLAVCQATAVFQDGRRFTGIGEAAESNVSKNYDIYYIRILYTKVSARVLRRALTVSTCSVEEFSGQEMTS